MREDAWWEWEISFEKQVRLRNSSYASLTWQFHHCNCWNEHRLRVREESSSTFMLPMTAISCSLVDCGLKGRESRGNQPVEGPAAAPVSWGISFHILQTSSAGLCPICQLPWNDTYRVHTRLSPMNGDIITSIKKGSCYIHSSQMYS